ncbi:FAD-binding oxidoreductase [Parvularcula dongshanensis]|uniref:FAD/FMN-containing dehydrogenase n=1 Tax=Parvularcula dongshanensis TaxID=1173995 RepID=A0A840I0L3_9PROT|nr:FAD-binding oxidoreductase [Parvularcula dongshanensis]MBB4658369.1 FAD/FMN-containing dehydrogenase [Parvularcula dongshanensis]
MTGPTAPSPEHINALTERAGPRALVEGPDREAHLTEWRGRWRGETPLILAPGSTEAVGAVLAYAYENGIAIVPQGGNTGLVGGQVPNGEVLVSTKRLRKVREVSPEGGTLTAEAGVTLAEVQAAAEEAGRLFPLSIGSEGTANVGGILSTNAGGVSVLRYGNARDLTLGIEAVLPDGRIWHGLNALRKNNTGYDLKQLFIGGEGTLGLITAAVLRLHPAPRERVTAFLSVPSAEAAVELLALTQERSGGQVTSFELMNGATVDLVLEHFSDLHRPVGEASPAYVLTELTAGTEGTLRAVAEGLLEEAFERGLVTDGTIAETLAQAEGLWAIRHNASEAMKNDPTYCVKCDVSVPVARVPAFLEEADASVEALVPGARVIAFGHMGDGNIHYDVLGPEGADDAAWRQRASEIERRVHDVVVAHEGSISAEHGIGQLKRDELAERKSPVEIALMRAVKQAFDPKGLMNPGKLLSPEA